MGHFSNPNQSSQINVDICKNDQQTHTQPAQQEASCANTTQATFSRRDSCLSVQEQEEGNATGHHQKSPEIHFVL